MNLNAAYRDTDVTNAMFSSMQRRILLVDDEAAIRTTFSHILEMSGFVVETAATAKEAVQKLANAVFQLIITDIKMETDAAGFEVIRAARQQAYDPAVVILSASPAPAGDQGCFDVQAIFMKDGNVGQLLQRLEALLTRHEDSKRKHMSSARTRR
jgi:DNA-binding response OmpR family regulator